MVDEFSATVAASQEDCAPIQADHQHMVKFADANDGDFKNILGIVRRLQRLAVSRAQGA